MDYYCRDCKVGVGPLTQDQALALIADGHAVLARPAPMPITDALADAETLRWFAFALRPRRDKRILRAVSELEDAVGSAGAHGDTALVVAAFGSTLGAFDQARRAARAAFRACPGLREE